MGKKEAKEAAHTKEARALRIYEYVDDRGVVFWSFTNITTRGAVHRLNPVDVRGTHFRTHISDIHRMAFQREILDEEE